MSQPGQPLSPTSQRLRQLVAAAGAVLLVLRPIGGRCRLEQLSDLGLEVGGGAVGRRGGVGLDLGAIQRDQPRRTIPAAAHSFNDRISRPATACS